jgi:hypothetical protein
LSNDDRIHSATASRGVIHNAGDGMTSLSKRLAKLEVTVRTVRAESPRSVSAAEVDEVALALLSHPIANLLSTQEREAA